ncbi:MAG TPA: energy transducer TonB [Myxococcota bacterium]|nr:energy transducer TonB [Myxococcota bacterium]
MSRIARELACAALATFLSAGALAAELLVEWGRLDVEVDAYQIERRLGIANEPFTPIARVDAFETRFRDRDVKVGVRYCYRVRGVRGDQVSPPSPELCSVAREAEPKPEPAPAPAPPPPRGENREVKALRRPPPVYPREAQLRGLSGWVRLAFTVAADGRTRDVRVLSSDPPGVFDQAAIDAAVRFVYLPRLENGVPVDRPNVETEVTFTWIDRGGDLVNSPRRRD